MRRRSRSVYADFGSSMRFLAGVLERIRRYLPLDSGTVPYSCWTLTPNTGDLTLWMGSDLSRGMIYPIRMSSTPHPVVYTMCTTCRKPARARQASWVLAWISVPTTTTSLGRVAKRQPVFTRTLCGRSFLPLLGCSHGRVLTHRQRRALVKGLQVLWWIGGRPSSERIVSSVALNQPPMDNVTRWRIGRLVNFGVLVFHKLT